MCWPRQGCTGQRGRVRGVHGERGQHRGATGCRPVDRAAVHELITQYRLGAPELQRLRVAGDSIADLVSREPGSRPADAGRRRRTDDRSDLGAAPHRHRTGRGTVGGGRRRMPTGAAERAVAAATHDGTIGAMETDIPGVTELMAADRRRRRRVPTRPRGPSPVSAAGVPGSGEAAARQRSPSRGGPVRQPSGRRVPAVGVTAAPDRPDGADQCRPGRLPDLCGRGGRQPQRVLLQFSAGHPGLRIEVADINTGSLSVFEGGVRTVHHERVPTHAEP